MLSWGSSVYARVRATNYLDHSDSFSEAGNGAVIYTFPDEPTNLLLNDEITWGTLVGLTWDEGA